MPIRTTYVGSVVAGAPPTGSSGKGGAPYQRAVFVFDGLTNEPC